MILLSSLIRLWDLYGVKSLSRTVIDIRQARVWMYDDLDIMSILSFLADLTRVVAGVDEIACGMNDDAWLDRVLLHF